MEPVVLGANVTKVTTDGIALHTLGQVAEVSGTKYMYVRSTAALTAYLTYYIDENFGVQGGIANHTCYPIALGTPQVAWAAPSGVTYNYGWVAIGGTGFSVKVDASCPTDVILCLGSTTGQIASGLPGLHQVVGLHLDATCGGSAAAVAATAAVPMFVGSKIRTGGHST